VLIRCLNDHIVFKQLGSVRAYLIIDHDGAIMVASPPGAFVCHVMFFNPIRSSDVVQFAYD
jgi:hypothetical protein